MFNDAKFGDKFLTRDGRLAIYHYRDDNPTGDNKYSCWHFLIVDKDDTHIICLDDGVDVGNPGEEWGEDIVSEYYTDKIRYVEGIYDRDEYIQYIKDKTGGDIDEILEILASTVEACHQQEAQHHKDLLNIVKSL